MEDCLYLIKAIFLDSISDLFFKYFLTIFEFWRHLQKVWVLVCFWPKKSQNLKIFWKSVSSCTLLFLYIPTRNIQDLTPGHFWQILAPFVKRCKFLYVSGPLTSDLEHTRTYTFWWKGVSPCMFLPNSYRLQKHTGTHTFS